MAAWVAFALASAFFLFEFVTRLEPSLAADPIKHFYHLSDARFGTLSSLFFWVYAPMQIVVGLLLDRYGARRFVLLGSFCCAAGVLVFTASPHLPMGQLGRMLTGFGASFAFVAALWLVNHWFAPERFALLSSIVNAVGMLGTAVGGVLLSGLIASAGWREVFVATGVAGMAIFMLALAFLREPPSPAAKATGPVATHVRQSLLAVIGNRRTCAIALIGLLYYMPVNVYGGLWGTTELVRDHHVSPVSAETLVSLIFCGITAGSVFSGWLSDRLGHRKWVVFVGALFTALAYAAALWLPVPIWLEACLLFARRLFRRPAAADLRHGQRGSGEPADRYRGCVRQHDRYCWRDDFPAAGGLSGGPERRRFSPGIDCGALVRGAGRCVRAVPARISPSRTPAGCPQLGMNGPAATRGMLAIPSARWRQRRGENRGQRRRVE